jgi:hypothetical protein
MTLLLMLVAAQAAAPLPATAPPAPPVPVVALAPVVATPASRALGREIARTLNSPAAVHRQSSRMFDQSMPKVIAADPRLQAIEKAHPGVGAAVIAAMRPIIEHYQNRQLPLLWDQQGDLYAGTLTEAEERGALAFYRTPTGIWLIEQVTAGIDLTPLLAKQVADPKREIKAAEVRGLTNNQASAARLSASMTPERAQEIMRFAFTSAGLKLRALNPRLAELTAIWANQKDPTVLAEIQTAVHGAVASFVGAAGQPAKTNH